MKQSRVTLLGEQLEAIKTEMGKRDLASVPTVFKGKQSTYQLISDTEPMEWRA